MTGSQGSLWVKGGDLHGRRNGGKEEVLYLDVEDLEVRNRTELNYLLFM